MTEQRMTPERRAEIEPRPLSDPDREYIIEVIADHPPVWIWSGLYAALLYTEQRLSAVEEENRVLREGLAEALGYLTQLRETSDAFSRMECASRAHAVLDGALVRAGGGADA